MAVSTSIAPGTGTAVPERMRAIALDAASAPRVVEVPVPRPVGAEVLVRVVAAGIDPTDLGAGGSAEGSVPGRDFSGVVVTAPYEGFALQPGDEVFGVSGAPRSGGSFAEYVAVPAANLARKPAGSTHQEAAAVPVAGLTAWGAVVDLIHAHEGQRVLVHAGAGGVGHLAVQLAATFGARVTATASSADLEWVRWLGAERVLDRDRTRFEDDVHDLDAVVDLVGDDSEHTGPRSLGALRPGGLLVSVPADGWATLKEDALRAGVRATHFEVAPDAATLAVLARLLDAGDLAVSVAEVVPLARIEDAVGIVMDAHVRGRVVLQVAR